MSPISLPPWAIVSPRRLAHIERVTALVDAWAAGRGVGDSEASRWHRAALLHDALRDAPAESLAPQAPFDAWPPALWHGPAAAEAAARHGETDQGVLDAVRYHSVGHAGWDNVGRALYLADFLEPGRDHDRERRAALAARVPDQLEVVLKEVAAERIGWLRGTGKPIQRETLDFWNRLIADDSSS